ncbi:MAG: hypothetical protein ACW97G_11160 [Candidatus Thorarchaeota archaeon]
MPPVFISMNADAAPVDFSIPAQIDHSVRVAIYDEDDTTVPLGASVVLNNSFTNNLNEVQTILEGAGHTVTLLDEQDILDHQLMTADFDVFVLVNNVPRDSIANDVYEYWLGGGGLLTFNKAFSYLSYQSIIWPDLGVDGYGILWGNLTADVMNVTERHSTMKDYHVGDILTEREADWAVIAEVVFDGSPVWDSITPLIRNVTDPDLMYAFAMDSNWWGGHEGGRLVHLPGDGSSIPTSFESIIVDSVEWLMPRPKGRIVYDLTHAPRLSVDPWDDEFATLYTPVNSFTQFRNMAVNHSYTFDKLYPSASGNLTAERLANYDVLMICWPDLNYTGAEIVAVEEWVTNGGSLLVLGDRNGLIGPNPGDLAINELLQNFDMSLGTTNLVDFTDVTPGTHVTLEGCTSLRMGYMNHLIVLSNATGIWYNGTYPVVAAQEFGEGRAILSADMNIFDNDLLDENYNFRYALNALNWLTSNDAEILVFASYDDHFADVVTALRDLGQSYQLIVTDDYIDDFLDSQSWELVILDQSNYWFTLVELDGIYAYINDGGKLILSYFDVDGTSTHPVWSKIGVEYSADISGTPEMFIWDSSHRIFSEPNDRNGANFTSNVFFGDDGDTLTVLEGYTAIAGSSATEQDGNAYIVLSDDYQTLYNGYLIDACTGDEDDSTYRDSVELWQNEIAFMLNPPGPGGLPFDLDPLTLLIIGGVVLGVIVIGALVSRRRGGGSSKPKKKTTKKKKK